MLRFACPACHSVIETPDEAAAKNARCGRCHQLLLVPPCEVAKSTSVDAARQTATASKDGANCRRVNYLHHTRDRDADVVFYFSDPPNLDIPVVLTSSPVIGMRRVLSGVVDAGGGEDPVCP